MTERPIIFSGPMVRAILAGKKTQTRRVVKTVDKLAPVYRKWRMKPSVEFPGQWEGEGLLQDGCGRWKCCSEEYVFKCPYGQPGDVLWVKETWGQPWHHAQAKVLYRATDDGVDGHPEFGGWKSPLFMPRWASRLSLEIKSVRVERVQDISRADMAAEGWPGDDVERAKAEAGLDCDDDCIEWFADLWDSINGKTYPWASNPWVWCLSFEVQQ